jgi:hypothetical protein
MLSAQQRLSGIARLLCFGFQNVTQKLVVYAPIPATILCFPHGSSFPIFAMERQVSDLLNLHRSRAAIDTSR